MIRIALSTLIAVTLVPDLSVLGQEIPPSIRTLTLGTTPNRTMSPYLTALSRDGKELAYRTSPDSISVFDPLSGKLLRGVVIDDKEVGEVLYYSPDCRHFIFLAMQQWRLVDAKTGKTLRTIGGGDEFDIYSHEFHWSDDCNRLTDLQQRYDFGFKPKVQVWDGREPRILGEIDVAQNGGNRCEAISGNGALIATSGRFHRATGDDDANVTEYVELWDAKTLKRKSRLHLGKDAYAVMLGFNADGKYLVTVTENDDGAVIWDTANEKKVATLGRFPGGYGRITFSPDDKHFAIQSITGYTIVYETATGRKLADRQDAGRVAAGVGFASSGDILSCFVDQKQVHVSVVNREQQPPQAQPVGHTQPVLLTRFADDGKTLLTVGLDDKVVRWDAATGKVLETVIHDPAQPSRFWDSPSAFSADGRFLVTSSGGRLSLYDVEKKQKIADLQTQNRKYYTRFSRVEFANDFQTLLAQGEGQENREDFNIVIVGYAAAWNTADGSLLSEYHGNKREDGAAVFAQHYGKEKVDPARGVPQNAPEVTVGPAIRDPWASSRNAGAMNVGNQLTLKDRNGKALLDRVLPVNNGRGISFTRDGKRLAIPMNDGTVQIFMLP